jgi:hypothetical protein
MRRKKKRKGRKKIVLLNNIWACFYRHYHLLVFFVLRDAHIILHFTCYYCGCINYQYDAFLKVLFQKWIMWSLHE